MTTDALERALTAALRAADDTPVDLAAGRRALDRRRQQRAVARRRAVIAAVAAGVLVIGLLVPALLAARGRDREAPPVRPEPSPTRLSPSGLPVGLLKGAYGIGGEPRTLRLLVRGDGTGQLMYPQTGHASSVVGPLDVRLGRRAGNDWVTVTFEHPMCPRSLVLAFSDRVTGDSVTILQVHRAETCAIEPPVARALPDTVLHVHPLPPGAMFNSGSGL